MGAAVSVAVPVFTATISRTWLSPAGLSSSMWTTGWPLRPGSFARYAQPHHELDSYQVSQQCAGLLWGDQVCELKLQRVGGGREPNCHGRGEFLSSVCYCQRRCDQFCYPNVIVIATITGDSGGGYVCAGAMVQLASKDEGDLVKLAVPIIAILDDYEFTRRESMMTDEAERVVMMQKIWQTIGGPDFEAKQSAGEPLLFPGWKLENWGNWGFTMFQARRMPVCWQGCLRPSSGSLSLTNISHQQPGFWGQLCKNTFATQSTQIWMSFARFASKLRAAGRLLELVVIPGGKHGSGSQPHFNVWRLEREAWRFAIQEYLVKEWLRNYCFII